MSQSQKYQTEKSDIGQGSHSQRNPSSHGGGNHPSHTNSNQSHQQHQPSSPLIDPQEFFLTDDLESTLSRQNFEKYKAEISKIGKNSALRKVYEACMEATQKSNPGLHMRLVFGKCYYQEKRKSAGERILVPGFTAFIEGVYDLCENVEGFNQNELFMMFMESLIAHHKSFKSTED